MGFAVERSRTIISAMIHGRRMTAQDVAWLRREVFADGEVTREEADELFAVARADMDNAPEWTPFFVEMIAAHVVGNADAAGLVDDERAAWLLERVDECRSIEALAALVNVAAEAQSVPQWFPAAVRARASGGWPRISGACKTATRG